MVTASQQAEVLADRLARDRDLITVRWLHRVRERCDATRPYSTPELVDRLPEFLMYLSDAVRDGGLDGEADLGVPRPTTTAAREHGVQRYRRGFDARALVIEYTLLIDVLFEYFAESGLQIDVYLSRAIVHELSLGVAAAIDQFSAEREADMRASHDALAQAREYERQLIGIVSHDLRNPLAIIIACADVVGRCRSLTTIATRALQRLRANAERAVRLIGDLLDFTQERILGQMPVKPQEADMQELVRVALEEVAMTHPQRRLEHRGETGPLPGRWDRDRVAQALANLLDNAMKFSPADTTVTVETGADERQVAVAVHNWGRPIPPERLALVFEAFQRVEPTASARVSLGLGLHISRQVALAHGGDLAATSSAERGTTFTLTLPRDPFAAPPAAAR